MNQKNVAFDKDISTFLENSISDVIDDIDISYKELLPKKSEIFTQRFLKDSKGELVVNAPVHNFMHRFIRLARDKGYNKFMVLGAFGQGKSMISGTYVIMYDLSLKKVEDIQIGDLLMGPDSKPRKVLFLGNGKEMAYRVTLRNGDSFECNESHIFSLKISPHNVYDFKQGDTVDLLLKEYLELPTWIRNNLKLYKTSLEFDYQKTPEDPYYYGQSIGNFRIKHGDKNSSFYRSWCHLKERCDNKNCEAYKYYGGRGITYDPKWNTYLGFKEDMYSKYLYAIKKQKIKEPSIERINVNDHYCYNNCCFIEWKDQGKNTRKNSKYNNSEICNRKFDYEEIIEEGIDSVYLKNSRNVRLQVLAGYLDIHGSINTLNYRTKTKSIKLRDNLLFLCRSLGFSVSCKEEKYGKTIFYCLVLTGDTYLIPCKEKKIENKHGRVNNYLYYSFDVEPIGIQPYYGFGLDGDHLFLHEDFTVLHNTEQLCLGWAMYEIAQNPNILIKLVHVSETAAIQRCRALRDYIQKDEDLHKIAPHLVPTPIWGSQRFIVKRTAMSKDGTVEAYGILSTGIGGRANLIIFDDPQDLKTAVLEPTTRQKIEDTFKNVWLTRLIPQDSEVLLMMNKWHESLVSGDVLTTNGIKDISNLKINDFVYSSGYFQKVLKTDKAKYTGNTYKVIPWYFSGLISEYTSDHEILTNNGWKYTCDLNTNDYLIVPIHTSKINWKVEIKKSFLKEFKLKCIRTNLCNLISKLELEEKLNKGMTYKQIADELNLSVGSIFNIISFYKINNQRINNLSEDIFDDKDFWRILGYWLAEGSLTYSTKKENRNVIRFTFGSHELDLINDTKEFFKKYNLHCGEDYTNRNGCSLKVSSFQLSNWLYNNFNERSENIKLPEWFFSLPEEIFFECINGYLLGDGCISKNGNIRFSSVSKSLLHGIQLNFLRFGIISSLYKYNTSGKKIANFGFGKVTIDCKDSYELRIMNDSKFAFIKDDKLYVKIRKLIKRKFVGNVYDITTNDHTFCSSGYIVHNSDLASMLMRNPLWSWMSLAVSEDLNYLIYKDSFGRTFHLPLWKLYNKNDFRTRLKELGERDFNRGFRLIPYSDSDRSFGSFSKCCHFGVNPHSIVDNPKNWFFIGGIDFAGLKRPGTVITVLAVHRKTGIKIPIEVATLKGSQELPHYMVKYFRKWGVDLFMAENNGVQDALIDLLISMLGQDTFKKYNIKIEGFLTGRNKADYIQGLPSMEKEMDNQEWMFCFEQEPPPLGESDVRDPWILSYYEFKNHPFYETSDIVMATWFAREGAKQFLRKSDGPNIW